MGQFVTNGELCVISLGLNDCWNHAAQGLDRTETLTALSECTHDGEWVVCQSAHVGVGKGVCQHIYGSQKITQLLILISVRMNRGLPQA